MKWWRDKPWNDAPTRCDVRRYPQVMMGEVTDADFEGMPRCRLRNGHKGGHDFTTPPGPGDPMETQLDHDMLHGRDPDGTQDEYRAALPTWTKGDHDPRLLNELASLIAGDGWVDLSVRYGAAARILDAGWSAPPPAPCGDPDCPEEHGDEDAPVDTYSDHFHRSNFGGDVPLAPWGGPAPQPPFAARRGLARAWFVRAAIVVLAVVLVLLLGRVR